MSFSARFIRSRSRIPMRRSDRAASLLSRKSQFTLKILEADILAARDLLLSATDCLDLIRQWIFRWGQRPHRTDVPADRFAQGLRPAQRPAFAHAVELGKF